MIAAVKFAEIEPDELPESGLEPFEYDTAPSWNRSSNGRKRTTARPSANWPAVRGHGLRDRPAPARQPQRSARAEPGSARQGDAKDRPARSAGRVRWLAAVDHRADGDQSQGPPGAADRDRAANARGDAAPNRALRSTRRSPTSGRPRCGAAWRGWASSIGTRSRRSTSAANRWPR